MSAIASYIEQLERELKARRAPRARLLAEAGEHLRASAAEIAANGVDAATAEEEAVARFGAAALVARRFAQAVATTSVRMVLLWAATAWASYAIAAALFALAAPSWLDDFPQGVPTMVALQVAAVALLVSGVRVRKFHDQPLIDEVRLRFVANGAVIGSGAVAFAAALELVFALKRPAPAPWHDAALIIAVYGVAAAAAVVACLAAAAVRAGVVAVLPRGQGELTPAVTMLVDDVAVAAPRLRPLAQWLTARPLTACAVAAALGFLVLAAVAIADDGLVGAAATGLFEAAAVVVAYLSLGRALGLRAPRSRVPA